ncbi:DNA-directed RNA polymerase subunit L [Methanohalobium sp.]|uniref:DNA-directed RNA polymerase subunit L n=1 Tax=Methanohalobium sp. TaxID=2837493 RepID=UPI0025F4A837|nr:DNA-directed RNA polymerase subunit L [Methanohalobium sp.]
MELKILNKTDYEINMEIHGEDHTLLNVLKSILLEDSRVEIASYDMKHVNVSEPILYVKTDGTDQVTVIKEALSKLISRCDEFNEVFSEAVKAC